MKYFDFTFPTPAENLAGDEALMDLCEKGLEGEILRFWEPQTPFVVLGYANHVALEVNLEACRRDGIPVFRRCSGGGTVVQGPGCLNYSLILRIDGEHRELFDPNRHELTPAATHPLRTISGTNKFILQLQAAAIVTLLNTGVQIQGHTDLSVRNLKFSGNAQRRLRNCLIFHGTFLLNFDISLIEKFLPMPSKQPCYRGNRPHADFLTNLNVPPTDVKLALRRIWNAEHPLTDVPTEKIRELVSARYSRDEWNLKF
jgi:lipoate---protein ligase